MSIMQSSTTVVGTPPIRLPGFGYYAVRNSDLVRSIPVICGQFLTTPLAPAQWFRLRALESDTDSMIAEFGHAMGKVLKSSADQAWLNDEPRALISHIDLIPPSAYARYAETLLYVRAMDIASVFLRIKNRSYYPNFEKHLHVDSLEQGIPGTENHSVENRSKSRQIQFLGRLDNLEQKLEKIRVSMRT
ncbi:hypothetical protein IW262DRAFT_1292365 [Armillaria fumosa]|nr:hypothetical protein IW262DRAFT_1292365 [Armillaria fumosa]